MARFRVHIPFVAILALALVLRCWKLDAIPNPCGDEGNWTWIPLDLLLGRPVALPPEARFVPMTFAYLIEFSFAHFGHTFAAARAVCVAGMLVGMCAAYALLTRAGARRAGLTVAWVVAIHPWAVLWSRTVSVPYALSFVIAIVGPVAYLIVAQMPDGRRRALGTIAAGQVLFVGLHFSPLAIVAVAACGVFSLYSPRARAMLRSRWTWIAVALGSLHVLYIARGALAVAERGTTRPNHQFTEIALRLQTYGRTVFGGLAGEATLRHFAAVALPFGLELVVIAATMAVLGLAIRGHVTSRREQGDFVQDLRALGLIYFVTALLLVPLMLAPARPWNLHAIDSERYLFAMLAPFALVLGALAEDRQLGNRVAAVAFAAYLLFPLGRVARALVFGGGTDRGVYLLAGGGGYRGWKTPRERVAVPWLIQSEVDRIAHRTPATILVADYAFHPLHFVNAETPYPTIDVTKFSVPDNPGERLFVVLWSEGLFAPAFTPVREVEANRDLRRRMERDLEQLRLLRTFVQPDGSPLFEVWTGIQRSPLERGP